MRPCYPPHVWDEALLNSRDEAFVALDEEFRFQFVNAAAEQIYATTRDQLLGKVLWEVFPSPSDRAGEQEIRRAMRDRVPTTFHTFNASSNRSFEAMVYPTDRGLAIHFRDITERKRAETVLSGQKLVLELALSGAPLEAMLDELVRTAEVQAADGTIASILLVEGNRLRHGAARGLPEVYNRAIDGIAIGRDVGSCGTAAYTGEVVIVRDTLTDARWAAFRELAAAHGLRACWSMPIRATTGAVLGTFALYHRTVRDPSPRDREAVDLLAKTAAIVIERARHTRALAAAIEAAEHANRSKDEFLAILGHELRNPLAPIVTALRLMEMNDDERSRWERAVITRQVAHVTRLVDDLLDVSRITRGRVALQVEAIDLADVVTRAVEMTTSLFEQMRHQLTVKVEPGLIVTGDATRLAQVIANLLTNAAKYSEPGSRTDLTATRRGASITVVVRDTGIGIAPELLPHVFELFTQANQAIDRARGGLGIGLAIVKNLVELHGGSVAVHSEGLGKGSAFTVELPATELPLALPSLSAPRAAKQGSPPRTILVVDDNTDIADTMVKALGELGHTVRAEHDGPAAVITASELKPDVAILDIGLPTMNGYEVARRIRAQPDLDRTLLVAVTGYGQQSDHDRAMEAGFDAHLAKPVDLDAVLGLIANLDRGSHRPHGA